MVWLSLEILLNFLNLDNLADYIEFVDRQPDIILIG